MKASSLGLYTISLTLQFFPPSFPQFNKLVGVPPYCVLEYKAQYFLKRLPRAITSVGGIRCHIEKYNIDYDTQPVILLLYEQLIRGPQGRITTVVFQFGLGDDWLKGAGMVRELEGTISTPQVGSLELKKLKELVDVVNHVK